MIVFLILVGITMKYIWPPITAALDERMRKIADGLSAADKAKAELAAANQRVEQQLAAARDDAAKRLADAERLAILAALDSNTDHDHRLGLRLAGSLRLPGVETAGGSLAPPFG